MLAIGIDTGGTCTDAVIYETAEHRILASAKAPTTHEALEKGILKALSLLPRPLLEEAGYLSLSTTLATNACVEHKGGRTCLIFIGSSRKTLEGVYRTYGFESTDFMFFLNGDPSKGIEPDWDVLEEALPRLVTEYDSFAVSQLMADRNNGAFEKECRRRIRAHSSAPVICAAESFRERNMIKRGAGALLNARLLPVIDRFLNAVKLALAEMGLKLPVVIMRSDGSLVSESYSREFPVETILCGPTASVKGGCALSCQDNAVIIDMGGTTTDIARVKKGEPVAAGGGVSVAGWRTLVRGIEVDTFALGGDTRVCFKGSRVFLDTRRAMPLSRLAAEYPRVEAELRELAAMEGGSGVPYYEYLLLLRSPKAVSLDDRERKICALLADGPQSMYTVAEATHTDLYALNTGRLEDEGIILRCGLTPTDAMVLEGSLSLGSRTAAEHAVRCLEHCTFRQIDLPKEVTALAEERLYCNLVRILWLDAHPDANGVPPRDLEQFAKEALEAHRRRKAGTAEAPEFYISRFTTDAVLVGVGAPTYRFLPAAAEALGARCVIPEHSGVCNALGAILGDVCVRETLSVRAEYQYISEDDVIANYTVSGREQKTFPTIEEAVEWAKTEAIAIASEKARRCGAAELYDSYAEGRLREGTLEYGSILLGAEVTARVRGRLALRL